MRIALTRDQIIVKKHNNPYNIERFYTNKRANKAIVILDLDLEISPIVSIILDLNVFFSVLAKRTLLNESLGSSAIFGYAEKHVDNATVGLKEQCLLREPYVI